MIHKNCCLSSSQCSRYADTSRIRYTTTYQRMYDLQRKTIILAPILHFIWEEVYSSCSAWNVFHSWTWLVREVHFGRFCSSDLKLYFDQKADNVHACKILSKFEKNKYCILTFSHIMRAFILWTEVWLWLLLWYIKARIQKNPRKSENLLVYERHGV